MVSASDSMSVMKRPFRRFDVEDESDVSLPVARGRSCDEMNTRATMLHYALNYEKKLFPFTLLKNNTGIRVQFGERHNSNEPCIV